MLSAYPVLAVFHKHLNDARKDDTGVMTIQVKKVTTFNVDMFRSCDEALMHLGSVGSSSLQDLSQYMCPGQLWPCVTATSYQQQQQRMTMKTQQQHRTGE